MHICPENRKPVIKIRTLVKDKNKTEIALSLKLCCNLSNIYMKLEHPHYRSNKTRKTQNEHLNIVCQNENIVSTFENIL